METVAGVLRQVPFPAISADSRVCLGLAGGPLLDVALYHRQCHVALRAGPLLFLEAVVEKGAEVSAVQTLGSPFRRVSLVLSASFGGQRYLLSCGGVLFCLKCAMLFQVGAATLWIWFLHLCAGTRGLTPNITVPVSFFF